MSPINLSRTVNATPEQVFNVSLEPRGRSHKDGWGFTLDAIAKRFGQQ